MRLPAKWLYVVLVLWYVPLCWSAEPPSPYAGQEQRALKSLSAEEVQGYLAGNGMGFAKVAELQHYPGPRHVLDLAPHLQLSEEQYRRTQSLFEEMRHVAVRLGTQLVERERHLEARFAAGTIAEAELEALVAEIATLQGQLRSVHLKAHIAQRNLLTPEQIRRYDMLRGYEASGQHAPGHRHGH
jgi:Spy/CpxP family protein refolding chaperone